MEKLELKHLAPYIAYDLKIKCLLDNSIGQLFSVSKHQYVCKGKFDLKNGTEFKEFINIDFDNFINLASPKNFLPILRPLSSLTKEIEHNGERFVPIKLNGFKHDIDSIIDYQNGFRHYKSIKYGILERLLEWHFDVFGLIEKGLAIDKNTLNETTI